MSLRRDPRSRRSTARTIANWVRIQTHAITDAYDLPPCVQADWPGAAGRQRTRDEAYSRRSTASVCINCSSPNRYRKGQPRVKRHTISYIQGRPCRRPKYYPLSLDPTNYSAMHTFPALCVCVGGGGGDEITGFIVLQKYLHVGKLKSTTESSLSGSVINASDVLRTRLCIHVPVKLSLPDPKLFMVCLGPSGSHALVVKVKS